MNCGSLSTEQVSLLNHLKYFPGFHPENEALKFLVRLGLVKKEPNGNFSLTDLGDERRRAN